MALKHKNDEFFCEASQTCTECHGPCRSPQTPKPWAIADEKGPNMKKR
jgi:hypothetical protein